MSTERVVLVGIIWAVLLLGLLILREFLRAVRTESRRRVLPVLDRLVVVMIIAFAGAAGLRLLGLIAPTTDAGGPGSTGATDIAAVSPSPTSSPTPVATTASPSPAHPSPSATATTHPTATPSPTLAPTPVPTPVPTAPPTPRPTAPPTVQPTVPPTPVPTQTPVTTPTPQATPDQGTVRVSANFRAFEVRDGTIRGYHEVRASAPFKAQSTAPQAYSFPTFSDPQGSIQLVHILTGPYAGTWVSPDDRGVSYSAD